jgi:hypothetical protein
MRRVRSSVHRADESQACPARRSEARSRLAKRDGAPYASSRLPRSEERALSAQPFVRSAPRPTRPVGAEFSRRRKLQNLAPNTLKSAAHLSTLHDWSDERRPGAELDRRPMHQRETCNSKNAAPHAGLRGNGFPPLRASEGSRQALSAGALFPVLSRSPGFGTISLATACKPLA